MKFNRSRLLQRPDLEENNYWENGVSKHLVSLFLNWLPGDDQEQQCRIFLACRAVIGYPARYSRLNGKEISLLRLFR